MLTIKEKIDKSSHFKMNGFSSKRMKGKATKQTNGQKTFLKFIYFLLKDNCFTNFAVFCQTST